MLVEFSNTNDKLVTESKYDGTEIGFNSVNQNIESTSLRSY